MSAQDHCNLLQDPDPSGLAGPHNRLDGTIVTVTKYASVVEIGIVCGPYPIVSVMPREAADELDLKPGDSASAILAPTEVNIETL
jgi:molybdopterin-binding protein